MLQGVSQILMHNIREMKFCCALPSYRMSLHGRLYTPVLMIREAIFSPVKYSTFSALSRSNAMPFRYYDTSKNLNHLKLKSILSESITSLRYAGFSSNPESSSIFSPWSWWKERQERNVADKYKQTIEEIAKREVWTVGPMLKEIEDSTNSWSAKLIDNKESRAVKHMKKVLEGLIAVVGKDAGADRIISLSRKEKLEIAIAGETTVEEINILIKHVQANEKIHRIVRKRKLEGKLLPETADAMQQLARVEFPKILTKDEKNQIKKFQIRSRKKI